ncbi:hypothetical protein BDU57DRAFT_525859 [Ampelomyces quisqualis]|uniref:Uncharacterized protein n=1 Tax=Ampelomyces quisqualis TaxID=50730 RepID=A0A6A5R071_AMPQU|nr:hypothetical protein BDU57DRAFT_525859 [Ampelomyces quisqualis]
MSESLRPLRYEYEHHKLFPRSAERGVPHILREHQESGPALPRTPYVEHELCDYVATFLHRLSSQGKHTKALDQFFDNTIPMFKFWRRSEAGDNWIIWRQGTEVICGIYTLGEGDEVNWRLVSFSKLSKVARDCFWTCYQGHKSAKSNGLLHKVQRTDIKSSNPPTVVAAILRDAKEVATAFGTGLLQHKIWLEEGKDECFVTVQILCAN